MRYRILLLSVPVALSLGCVKTTTIDRSASDYQRVAQTVNHGPGEIELVDGRTVRSDSVDLDRTVTAWEEAPRVVGWTETDDVWRLSVVDRKRGGILGAAVGAVLGGVVGAFVGGTCGPECGENGTINATGLYGGLGGVAGLGVGTLLGFRHRFYFSPVPRRTPDAVLVAPAPAAGPGGSHP